MFYNEIEGLEKNVYHETPLRLVKGGLRYFVPQVPIT